MSRTFVEALRHALDQTGVSVRSIATKTGIPYDRVKQVANGRTKTTNADDAFVIARSFGVSVEEFMAGRLNRALPAPATPESHSVAKTAPPGGFSDAPTPFEPKKGSAMFDLVNTARNRGAKPMTYRMPRAIAVAGILAGDIVAIDTAMRGATGDLVLCSVPDIATGAPRTAIARRYDPWLAYDGGQSRMDSSGETAIYGQVICVVRGELFIA